MSRQPIWSVSASAVGLGSKDTSFSHCMSPPGPAMKPSRDIVAEYSSLLIGASLGRFYPS